ncbi:MAG TPA: 4Fe-4S binding protein [Candidatus Aquicultor sp.]
MKLSIDGISKKNPSLAKLLTPRILRKAVQLIVVAILMLAAWQFYDFVEYIRSGGIGPIPNRPPAAEGLLPIAAILAFKAFLAIRVIDPIHPAGLMIFIATIAIAWLFRRSLCSWICPIGTLSEYLAAFGRKTMGRNLTMPEWLDIALLAIKYAILLFILRTFILMPTAEAISFMQLPFYAVSDIKMFDLYLNLSVTGFAIITALVVGSIFIKSFWCRYLCPYGALLGILGLLSPVVLTKNNETCIDCGKCNKACPNNVNVQGKRGIVATAECIGCTSCVSVCPTKGTLTFKLLGIVPITPIVFGISVVVVFFGIIAAAQLSGHWDTNLTVDAYRTLDHMMSNAATNLAP